MTALRDLCNLEHLLGRHGASTSSLIEISQLGFSGARIFKQADPEGVACVVKVTTASTDWIMRATSDRRCREAVLAKERLLGATGVHSPAIDSAQDGAVFSIVMRDVSEHLLANEPLSVEQCDAVLRGMASLHSQALPTESVVSWCSIEDRVTLFMPDAGKLDGFRIGNDILKGWDLFFDRAPTDVAHLVQALFDDIQPLTKALAELPSCLLHGDLKLDNIAILPDASLSLIDWSMPMIAPAAIDLGWFLAMNSRVLPRSLDETIEAYTSCASIEASLQDRHRSLTILCGLLIRGWRKALDAEAGDPAELRWWCDRASSASKIL